MNHSALRLRHTTPDFLVEDLDLTGRFFFQTLTGPWILRREGHPPIDLRPAIFSLFARAEGLRVMHKTPSRDSYEFTINPESIFVFERKMWLTCTDQGITTRADTMVYLKGVLLALNGRKVVVSHSCDGFSIKPDGSEKPLVLSRGDGGVCYIPTAKLGPVCRLHEDNQCIYLHTVPNIGVDNVERRVYACGKSDPEFIAGVPVTLLGTDRFPVGNCVIV